MGEIYQQQTSSRYGLRGGGGQIVEVEGGHILRSTGRKDRHSKVCTAKGPRDRRVRLAAHTAIQFYDVQDRLGYDRPSKAVDWLIKKAKTAIDELEKLPAWKPSTGLTTNKDLGKEQSKENHQDSAQPSMVEIIAGPSSKRALSMVRNEGEGQGLPHLTSNIGNGSSSISFLPPSMDSDSIADTIKSFFPMGASAESNTSAMQFQSSHSQDLKLSLQSFQDPIMLHHQHQQPQHQNPTSHNEQELVQAQEHAAFFSGNTPAHLGFDGSGWSDHHQQPTELGRFQRFTAWNSDTSGGATAGGGGVGGYLFSSAPLQPFFGGQNQFFSQRGPLQSSYTPPVRAWIDPSAIAIEQHQHHQAMLLNYPQSLSGIGFASGISGFSGFHIPARIQGDEEEHDGISDKPSSASSDSRR